MTAKGIGTRNWLGWPPATPMGAAPVEFNVSIFIDEVKVSSIQFRALDMPKP